MRRAARALRPHDRPGTGSLIGRLAEPGNALRLEMFDFGFLNFDFWLLLSTCFTGVATRTRTAREDFDHNRAKRDGLTDCLPNNLRQISRIYTDKENGQSGGVYPISVIIRAIRG